jgi:hypothetical protein
MGEVTMTKIYIHTYGRADRQVTWDGLPPAVRKDAVLVVQHRERKLYEDYPVLVLPKSIEMLSPTRHHIVHKLHDVDNHGPNLVMMDDDLRFCVRRTDEPDKFRSAEPKDVSAMFKALFGVLGDPTKKGKVAHAGVVGREGGNRITEPVVYCTRMMRILGYHVPTIRAKKVRFDRLPFQQDFDMTLQLLRLGYPNAVLAGWAQDQGTSNAPGGCATYRTLEKLAENARKLAELHHPFVKVVAKKTKGAWGGAERLDVQVAWKKAYAEGAVHHG